MGAKEKETQELIDSMGLGEYLMQSISVIDDKQTADGDRDPEIPGEDHDYGDDVQLQEAIFNSMQVCNKRKSNSYQDLELEDNDDACERSPDIKQKGICGTSCKVEPHVDVFEIWSRTQERGEASWSVCEICGDDEPTGTMKRPFECHHFFCQDCLRAYVGKTIQKNIYEEVKCPAKKCKKTWIPEQCVSYLPPEVADRWFEARCVAEVLASPTFIRCPFEDCCGLFLDDRRRFLIRACPSCWRIFCMRCRVGWHMGLNCRQVQNLRRFESRTVRGLNLLEILPLLLDWEGMHRP